MTWARPSAGALTIVSELGSSAAVWPASLAITSILTGWCSAVVARSGDASGPARDTDGAGAGAGGCTMGAVTAGALTGAVAGAAPGAETGSGTPGCDTAGTVTSTGPTRRFTPPA